MSDPVVLLLAAAMQIQPEAAAARSATDWRIRIEIGWAGVPPMRVTVQSPATGGNDFVPSSAPPIRIDYAVGRHTDKHPVTVHFRSVSHAFAVLPRLDEPAFQLKLTVPRNMNCDNTIVTNIARKARSSEAEDLANAGLGASYLLQRTTNKCTSFNVGRLRRALLDSHCNLAKNTILFSVPSFPEAALEREASLCRQTAKFRMVTHQFEQAGSQVRSGEFGELDVTLAGLNDLRDDQNWSAAFSAAHLDENNLRHLEVQGLYNRAVPLRNEGHLKAAKPFAAQLASLAERSEYQEAFRRADLTPDQARDIYRGIMKRLDPPESKSPDEP